MKKQLLIGALSLVLGGVGVAHADTVSPQPAQAGAVPQAATAVAAARPTLNVVAGAKPVSQEVAQSTSGERLDLSTCRSIGRRFRNEVWEGDVGGAADAWYDYASGGCYITCAWGCW